MLWFDNLPQLEQTTGPQVWTELRTVVSSKVNAEAFDLFAHAQKEERGVEGVLANQRLMHGPDLQCQTMDSSYI